LQSVLQIFLGKFLQAVSSNSVEYLQIVDTASPPSGDVTLSLPSSQPLHEENPWLAQIPPALFEELWLRSEAETVALSRSEFAGRLTTIGTRHNHGLRSFCCTEKWFRTD